VIDKTLIKADQSRYYRAGDARYRRLEESTTLTPLNVEGENPSTLLFFCSNMEAKITPKGCYVIQTQLLGFVKIPTWTKFFQDHYKEEKLEGCSVCEKRSKVLWETEAPPIQLPNTRPKNTTRRNVKGFNNDT
jgi:hypothetical protein